MKNKKIGIISIILGVLLLVIGIVLMVVGTKDKTLPKVEDNNNECKYNLSKDGELVLDFKCDSFSVSGDKVTFKFDKKEDSSYDLNVMYDEKNIYSSLENKVDIYTEEQAGNTSIINIDDLYFVYTYAAGQCGDFGHLIVVSKDGEVINTFNGMFKIDLENSVLYVRSMTDLECSSVDNSDGLYEQYNVVGSRLNKVGSVYEFNLSTVIKDGNLEFVYGNEEENLYLNILYNGNNIFSSKDCDVIIYSSEQAGHTKISKIDNVYLVDTAAAHQCGEKGTLIVVNGNGELLGVFDSLNFDTNKQEKSISFTEDKDNLCANLEIEIALEEITYYIDGNSFTKF